MASLHNVYLVYNTCGVVIYRLQQCALTHYREGRPGWVGLDGGLTQAVNDHATADVQSAERQSSQNISRTQPTQPDKQDDWWLTDAVDDKSLSTIYNHNIYNLVTTAPTALTDPHSISRDFTFMLPSSECQRNMLYQCYTSAFSLLKIYTQITIKIEQLIFSRCILPKFHYC